MTKTEMSVDVSAVGNERKRVAEAIRRMKDNRTLVRIRSNRIALTGSFVLIAIALIAVVAPAIAPTDPNAQDLLSTRQPPSGEAWLGTDSLGRDVLSRLIYGARVSMLAGLLAVSSAALLGVPTGLVAGYFGGTLDRLFTLLNNALLSLPSLVLALAVISALGPGLFTAMGAVGVAMMPKFFRLARSSTREVAQEPYIRGSVSVGCATPRILFAHVLPNIMSPLVVQVSFSFGTAVIAEASLSFLGLGVRPPTASWGAMLADASTALHDRYLLVSPAIALTLTVLAFTVIGDGLRDALGVSRSRSSDV